MYRREVRDPDDPGSGFKEVTELISEIDPDLSDRPLFAELRDYWAARRPAGGGLPLYADMDPLDLREHLGSLFVIERHGGKSDFRYRLIGTDLTLVHGADYTGRSVQEAFSALDPAFRTAVVRAYRKCLSERKPMLGGGQVLWANKDHLRFESLHLPCSSDGEHADIIFGRLDFMPRYRG